MPREYWELKPDPLEKWPVLTAETSLQPNSLLYNLVGELIGKGKKESIPERGKVNKKCGEMAQ